MTLTPLHDPLNLALELREQMATQERRIVFFFGAGTSMASGLPGLIELTKLIQGGLKGSDKDSFDKIATSIGPEADIEQILNQVRILRELLGEDATKAHDGISGSKARELDIAICQEIYKSVSSPDPAKIASQLTLGSWIRKGRRAQAVEIFTTNYDLIFELAFEKYEIPYFDGFVGAVEPFFCPRMCRG